VTLPESRVLEVPGGSWGAQIRLTGRQWPPLRRARLWGGGGLCPQLVTSDFRFYTSDFRDQTSGSWDQTSGNAEAAASDTGMSKLTIFYGLSM
jgi:hypothetical protein